MKKLTVCLALAALLAGCGEKTHADESFTDTSWIGSGLSELVFREDGSFSWYQYEGKTDGDRYEGTYEAYRGSDAVDYITSLEEYRITEKQLAAMFTGEEGHTESNFIAYTLKDDHVFVEGKDEQDRCDTLTYYGYLTETDSLLNAVNMRTGSLCTFEKKTGN